MAQLVLAHFSGLLVKNRNLLPTGMEITPYNKHRRLLLPQRLSSSSTTKERLHRIEREPSLLSHQASRPSFGRQPGQSRSARRKVIAPAFQAGVGGLRKPECPGHGRRYAKTSRGSNSILDFRSKVRNSCSKVHLRWCSSWQAMYAMTACRRDSLTLNAP